MSNPPSPPPRLPSPPPFPEIQIGPKSPSIGAFSDTIHHTMDPKVVEANANRRIHPGTKAADMAAGPPLVLLEELDTAFQFQEHLKALHYFHTKPPSSENTVPINRETATIIATPPEGVDPSLWLYELCRLLINKCNDLIIGFLFDDPPCSQTTCPEMRASEWQFLCAVHETPKSCCAIDYCCHTLDWATNIVTSRKNFPTRARIEIGGEMGELSEAGKKQLVNIFRRLHRIFAHAWFQHRGVFWNVEAQTGLYVLFKTVCDTHLILPQENFKLPPEAEGLEQTPEPDSKHIVSSILRSDNSNRAGHELATSDIYSSMGRTSTKRHVRSSPSTGSAVTTVLETDEVDDDGNDKLDEIFFTRDIPVTRLQTDTEMELELEHEAEAESTLEPEVESAPESEPLPGEKSEKHAAKAATGSDGEQKPETSTDMRDIASFPVIITPDEDEEKEEEQGDKKGEEKMELEEAEELKEEKEEEEEEKMELEEAKEMEEEKEEEDEEKKKEENVEADKTGQSTDHGAEDQQVYEDEAELEAFEEVPIPQLHKDPPFEPGLKREETLKPVKPENEAISDSDKKPDEKIEPESESTKDGNDDHVNADGGDEAAEKDDEEAEKPGSEVS